MEAEEKVLVGRGQLSFSYSVSWDGRMDAVREQREEGNLYTRCNTGE